MRTSSSARSLGYPTEQNSSGKKVSCEWVIQSSSSRRIRLTLTDFVMTTSCCSCERDFLEIRDGENKSAPLIGRFCAKHFPKIVYSTRRNIWVQFHSDFMRDRSNRFRLSYEAICGRHMASLTGSFTSPNFPANYDNNLDCIYSIEVPLGRIRVEFESFHIEGRMPFCLSGYLEVQETAGNVVYSQPEKNLASSRKFCGQEIPKVIYSTQNSYFWFHFKSNSFRTSGGFNATYRTLSVGEGSCEGTLTDVQGQIFSQNYPFVFPLSKKCHWKILVPEGKHVHLSFSTFNFSNNEHGCKFARLEIYDGLTLNPNLKIGRYCGSTRPKKVISRTNEMSLRAVSSDASHTGWFALRYTALPEGPCGKNNFACNDRQCIENTQYCDGVRDCDDGSDESKCSIPKETFSWYSFWPLSVALVILLMGLWLWRTWKKFVGSRSEVERSCSNCTSPCHHNNSNNCVLEEMEPPSYREAVTLGNNPPPSYEEAVAQGETEIVDSCNGSPSDINTQSTDDGNENSQVSFCRNSSTGEQCATYTAETASSSLQQQSLHNSVTETWI